MKWEIVPAEDFCESVRDGTHGAPKPTDSGRRLVTGKHIKSGQIHWEDAYFISEEDFRAINGRSLVEQWDVLMSMIGTVGECAVVKAAPDYAIKNIALFKLGGSEWKAKWLYYYLCSPKGRGELSGSQSGSSQQFISLKRLRAFPVLVAEEGYMKRTVEILSAYDDLMEANRRQMELLEESALLLYKKWFPERPDASIPEERHPGTLSEIAEFRRGKTITRERAGQGTVPVVAGGLEPAYFHDRANTKAPVVTVSGSGANAGFTRLYYTDVWASDCSWIDCETAPHLFFAYCYLKVNRMRVEALQKGAAQPHVYAKDINSLPLLVPSDRVLNQFADEVKPVFAQIAKRNRQNELLGQARDCLLPKLLNGETK